MISLIILIVLLALSGYFSSLEAAFLSLTPGEISTMSETKGRRGRLVEKLTSQSDVLLSTLLLGNNLANLGASALTAGLTIELFGNTYIAAATGLLTLLVLVFCEITPKQIALVTSERLCLRSAHVILGLSWIFRPAVWLVSTISSSLMYLFIGSKKKQASLDHLLHHIKIAENQGIVQSYEQEMVRNVFRINDVSVEAIMTHRTNLFCINETMTVAETVDAFLGAGYSRAPVLKKDSEHVLGVVELGSLMSAYRNNPADPVSVCTTKPHLVPGTMKTHELFFRLNKEPINMAIVLDEYGGLDGVVTREDITEEIFGELYDERDNEVSEPIMAKPDGSWIIRGDADFYDVSDTLGLKLGHDNRTYTMGGYLLEKLGRIPTKGTTIELPEGKYKITELKKQRITSVQFYPSP